MKVRNSLVSNSSSSSFIVVFHEKPQSLSEVHKILFNEGDGFLSLDYHDGSLSYKEISERVFNDLKNKKRATKRELLEEFSTVVYHKLWKIEDDISHHIVDYTTTMRCCELFGNDKIINIIKEYNKIDKKWADERTMLWNDYGITYQTDHKDWPKKFIKEDADLNEKRLKDIRPLWDKKDKLITKAADKMAKEFIENHKSWWYTILSYADDGGDSIMEHGNIFSHIEHIKISHH